MARLATPLEATVLAAFWRLEPRAIDGGWFGGVAGPAADSLPPDGQFDRHGADL